jgi:hypothetical protein
MYLILQTKEEAIIRSREAWEAVLSRKKRAGDVTEFLWDIAVGKDGRAAINISEKPEILTAAELQVVVTDLPRGTGENWEKVRSV